MSPSTRLRSLALAGGLLAAAAAGRAAPEPEPGVVPSAASENDHALNPTGGPVRVEGMDAWGGGEYLARRNDRENRGLSLHHAIDYVGRVGQEVVAPITGELRRTGKGPNTGAVIVGRIRGQRHKVKLMHFTVTARTGPVRQGQVIGKVLNLGRFYKGMTSHVHMEVHEWRNYVGYRAKDPSIVVGPPSDATVRR